MRGVTAAGSTPASRWRAASGAAGCSTTAAATERSWRCCRRLRRRPAEAVGAELDDYQVVDCRTRLGDRAGLSFVSIASLDSPAHHGRYDAVVCMEVLEHVVELDPVIDRLWRLLAAGRHPAGQRAGGNRAAAAREAGRRDASRAGAASATTRGRARTAGVNTARACSPDRGLISRGRYTASATPFHDHKGFNWMALRDRLAQRFVIDRVVASPMSWLGPHLATQVWFVATEIAARRADSPL